MTMIRTVLRLVLATLAVLLRGETALTAEERSFRAIFARCRLAGATARLRTLSASR